MPVQLMASPLDQDQYEGKQQQDCNRDPHRGHNGDTKLTQWCDNVLYELENGRILGAQNRGHRTGCAGRRVYLHYELGVFGLEQNLINDVQKSVARPALAHYFGARLAEQK